jgi:Glycosyl transferases group 1
MRNSKATGSVPFDRCPRRAVRRLLRGMPRRAGQALRFCRAPVIADPLHGASGKGRDGCMRILVSCQQSAQRHPIPAYDFWRQHFVCGLAEAGHEVLEVPGVDWAEGLAHPPGAARDLWRDRSWESVRAFVRAEQRQRPIDLFLGYLYPQQIEVKAIGDLQKMGIPCVNFFCDNVREFRSVPNEFRPFALHWVPEFEALPMYRAAGLAHVHAPMPCWTENNLRSVPTAETEPPTFVGSADILRRDLLSRASQAGAKFKVCGPGWAPSSLHGREPERSQTLTAMIANQFVTLRNHGATALLRKVESRIRPLSSASLPPDVIAAAPAHDTEYFRMIREATVCLGVNRVPTARHSSRAPLRYSRLRDIEAPMLGACYLTEWTEGLGHLFEVGTEIEAYRTPEELVAKLGELTADPKRRRAMRARAQRRALNEHCVPRSIARIAERLGLAAA